jgi:argininosuccinate lyase
MSVDRSQVYVKHVLQPIYQFTKENFLPYILEITIAHIKMLETQKILPPNEARTLIQANQELLKEGFSREYDPSYEDLFFMMEAYLSEKVGADLVGNMHIAFSRNDMDATMFRMLWREKLVTWRRVLLDLKQVILDLAEEHEDTVMPAYTHNQQAQPTTFAHYLLAVDQHLERDLDRSTALLKRMNQSPMGACALGTTGFQIDRKLVAKQLGFDGVMGNSYDAIGAADYMLELVHVMSTSLSTLSRFVYDLMFLATNEVEGIRLDESLVQTSSIMPQKRNPSSLEHTRSLISRTIGELQAGPMMVHSVPFGDIVDIGDDIQPVVHNGFSQSYQIMELLAEILRTLTVNRESLLDRCRSGFSTVTELADQLVRHQGLSFREAHHVVQIFVRNLVKAEKSLKDGTADQVQEIVKEVTAKDIVMNEEEFQTAIDPMHFVSIRSVEGGPSPKETRRLRQLSEDKQIEYRHEIDRWITRFNSYKLGLLENS